MSPITVDYIFIIPKFKSSPWILKYHWFKAEDLNLNPMTKFPPFYFEMVYTFLNLDSPLSQILPGFWISFDLNQITWFKFHSWAKSIFEFRKDFKISLIVSVLQKYSNLPLNSESNSNSSILNPLFGPKLSLVRSSKSFELNSSIKVQIPIFREVQALVWISKTIQIYLNLVKSAAKYSKYLFLFVLSISAQVSSLF